jgi:hypothetical protein
VRVRAVVSQEAPVKPGEVSACAEGATKELSKAFRVGLGPRQ